MSSDSMKKYNDKPITHLDDLPSIEKHWREIYGTISNKSIFISFDYIMLWYHSFAKPEQVRIYPIYEGDKLIGFLPLILYKKGPARILSSLTNSHCDHPAVLIAAGYEKVFFKKCFDKILLGKEEWAILEYHYYSFQQDPDLKRFSEMNPRIMENTRPTYSIMLPDSFEKYINNYLSKKLRKNLKDQKHKLKKLSSYKFCHYTGDKAIASWSIFLSIEDSGWKGDRGSSIKRLPKNYRLYYESLIDLLYKNDKLHMYFLNVDGQPIAGLFCYEDQNILHAWKSGYVEGFSSLSPSNALLLFVIEDLIINFPTIKILHMFPNNPAGYKDRFAHEEYFYIMTTLFNKTIYGRIAYNLAMLKQWIKLHPNMYTVIDFIRNITSVRLRMLKSRVLPVRLPSEKYFPGRTKGRGWNNQEKVYRGRDPEKS